MDQGQQPEDSPEVAINVIEDESVTFSCQRFSTLNVRPQTVTEGDVNIQINVTIDANPFPSFFTWSRNDVPITSSSNVALTATSITFTTVQRDNAGTYTVYSNNTAGDGSTTFELIVQCKLLLLIYSYT